MYNNENTIKLFDSNNNFVKDFDAKIEEIEISIHGPNYYDVDEELVNTNEIPIKQEEVVKNIKKKEHKFSLKDLLPLVFILLIFGIVLYAGYYFLGNFDVTSLING